MRTSALLPIGALGLLLAGAAPAVAQNDLSTLRGASTGKPVTVGIACGNLDKGNCKLLPRVQAEAGNRNVTVDPFKSAGSVESTQGVCEGAVPMAIAQRDAVDSVIRDPLNKCAGKLLLVGQAIYPYYGYLVVKADAEPDDLYEIIDDMAAGQFAPIGAGRVGSGGQVTLRYLLESDPKLKKGIKIESVDQSLALDMLRNNQLQGYFVMDGPQTDLVEELRKLQDPKTERPLFKFIDVEPWSRFFRDTKAWNAGAMFYEAEIKIPGWFSSDVTTVATDAVLIANKSWAEQNPQALRAVRESFDTAMPAIRADLNVPGDWAPK